MTATQKAIASFYDAHSQRLLRDFVHGNLRTSAAIERVVGTLVGRSGRLLDIGCGIGTTSSEYAKALPEFEVVGVDISPLSIETAQKLFGGERIQYRVADMSIVPEGGPFDAIALIDMYEHIPRADWPRFNSVLASCLASDGIVILTTPGPLHQEHLREHEPDGLQIVDETVELADIVRLTEDLDATLTYYHLEDVWRTNQYLHVVIERAPRYEVVRRPPAPEPGPAEKILGKLRGISGIGRRSTEVERRRAYVKERLGTDVA